MNEEMELKSQIERAKEIYSELIKELQSNLNSIEVTLKTKNLTEDIFVKLRICLDKAVYYYLNKNNYNIDLSKVQFPISKREEDFNSLIINCGLKNLNQDYPSFFNLISSSQPFSSKDKEILTILHKIGSQEKHKFLVKEKREVTHIKTTFKSPMGEISWTPNNVKFGGQVLMNGIPINLATQEPAFIPQDHQLTRHYQILIKLEEEDIEISSLCNSLIKLVEEIINKIVIMK